MFLTYSPSPPCFCEEIQLANTIRTHVHRDNSLQVGIGSYLTTKIFPLSGQLPYTKIDAVTCESIITACVWYRFPLFLLNIFMYLFSSATYHFLVPFHTRKRKRQKVPKVGSSCHLMNGICISQAS